MPELTAADWFALRVQYLADQLDQRVRLARENKRMVELDARATRNATWFIAVSGVGHGGRPGIREIDGPPAALIDPALTAKYS